MDTPQERFSIHGRDVENTRRPPGFNHALEPWPTRRARLHRDGVFREHRDGYHRCECPVGAQPVVPLRRSGDDDRVSFKSFALLRITRTPEGEEQVQNVYSADITVKAGKPVLVGAAQAPNSKKALFFRLEANPR